MTVTRKKNIQSYNGTLLVIAFFYYTNLEMMKLIKSYWPSQPQYYLDCYTFVKWNTSYINLLIKLNSCYITNDLIIVSSSIYKVQYLIKSSQSIWHYKSNMYTITFGMLACLCACLADNTVGFRVGGLSKLVDATPKTQQLVDSVSIFCFGGFFGLNK